jgi:hypothetical protein
VKADPPPAIANLKPDDVDAPDGDGLTALHRAAQRGDVAELYFSSFCPLLSVEVLDDVVWAPDASVTVVVVRTVVFVSTPVFGSPLGASLAFLAGSAGASVELVAFVNTISWNSFIVRRTVSLSIVCPSFTSASPMRRPTVKSAAVISTT